MMKKFVISVSYCVLCGVLFGGIGKAFGDFNHLYAFSHNLDLEADQEEGLFVLEYTGKINDEAIDNFIKEKKALDERVEKREQEEKRKENEERDKKKGIVNVSNVFSSISVPQLTQYFVSSSWTCSRCGSKR